MKSKTLLKNLCLWAILLSSPIAFGQQKKPEIAPEYYTPYDILAFTFSDSQWSATYGRGSGKIVGRLEGNQLKGTWQQGDGSGSIILTFSPDFSTFKGKHSYNQTPDKWIASWSGMRKPAVITRLYKTPWGILTCNFEGSQVSASYPWFNGRILGELKGNQFTGIWLQSNKGIGNLRITFARDWSRFRGRYNDFNFHPDKWYEWKGELQQ
jgi:hypothetical protein